MYTHCVHHFILHTVLVVYTVLHTIYIDHIDKLLSLNENQLLQLLYFSKKKKIDHIICKQNESFNYFKYIWPCSIWQSIN